MASLGIWKKRMHKFLDNPRALWPFVVKKCYHNFVCDRYLSRYEGFTFLGPNETIDHIIDENKSIVRFGDEAIDMTRGIGLYYEDWHQKYDRELARRYKEVLAARHPRLLVAYNPQFFLKTKAELRAIGMPPQIWTNSKVFLWRYLHSDVPYGTALCLQPQFNPDIDFQKLGDYFKTKHVVIVTGKIERFSHIALGKTTDLLGCPKNDVWSQYGAIYRDAIALVKEKGYRPDETLFLISLACTAKVMAYDLTVAGYQAWDTGQFFDLAFREISAAGNTSTEVQNNTPE
jgi:hypothetical protein